jgi:hypothetical protein
LLLWPSMRSREEIIFLTADRLEEQAASRIREAEQLPPGKARQHALRNAAQLQSFAEMKRNLAPAVPVANQIRTYWL